MHIIFNIGLESKDAEGNVIALDHEAVCEFTHELAGVGFWGAIHESHTEQTLVIEFDYAELRKHIGATKLAYRICERFNQDCVAVYNTALEAGQLIGPRAEAWGDFNPEYFFLVDGTHPVAAQPEVLH